MENSITIVSKLVGKAPIRSKIERNTYQTKKKKNKKNKGNTNWKIERKYI